MVRPLVLLSVASVIPCTLSCRTDQNEPRDRTKATIGILATCFDRIAQTAPSDFHPVNFKEFSDYLFDHEFLSRDPYWLPNDGWGRPYKLFVSVENGDRVYLVNSAGADGVRGTDDDISLVVEIPASKTLSAN
jgi:hypothetical protein